MCSGARKKARAEQGNRRNKTGSKTLAPGKIQYDYRVLLPGYSDELAYELGLIENSVPFAEARRRAVISSAILQYKDEPRFSQLIRGEKIR